MEHCCYHHQSFIGTPITECNKLSETTVVELVKKNFYLWTILQPPTVI